MAETVMKRLRMIRMEQFEMRTLMSGAGKLGEEHHETPPASPAMTVPARASELKGMATGRNVALTWKDNSADEAGFDVFRVNLAARTLTKVGHVDANVTTFTEANAPVGSDVYAVRAVNADGKGEVSNLVTVKIAEPVIVSAPTKLRTEAVSTTSIRVRWEAAKNATGYTILRSADGVSGWTTIGATAAKPGVFVDTKLTAGTKYYYKVVATGATGTATSATVIGQTKQAERKDAKAPEHGGQTEPHK